MESVQVHSKYKSVEDHLKCQKLQKTNGFYKPLMTRLQLIE